VVVLLSKISFAGAQLSSRKWGYQLSLPSFPLPCTSSLFLSSRPSTWIC